jgi:UDP-glucuronate 4-epimerase
VRVLLTGGAGFIGASLLQTLKPLASKIVVLDKFSDYYSAGYKRARFSTLSEGIDIELIESDLSTTSLSELFAKQKFDLVIHLAAQPGLRINYPVSIKYVSDNIAGFANVLQASLESQVNKFIYASSSSVYENSISSIYSETDMLQIPSNIYAKTKWINEVLADEFIGKSNTSILGLRMFSVFGPWGRPDMAPFRLITSCLTDYVFEVNNNGSSRRDFSYIGNVTQMISNLLKLERMPQGVINLGTGNDRSILEVIEVIERVSGLRVKIKSNLEAINEISATKSDPSKLNKTIGKITYVSFEDSIAETIFWAKSKGILENLEGWINSV